MCVVKVIGDGSTFIVTLQNICKALKITYWCISRGNHKGNSIKTFRQFLNKTQTITGVYRGTYAGFIKNTKTFRYAWNSAPIDDI